MAAGEKYDYGDLDNGMRDHIAGNGQKNQQIYTQTGVQIDTIKRVLQKNVGPKTMYFSVDHEKIIFYFPNSFSNFLIMDIP